MWPTFHSFKDEEDEEAQQMGLPSHQIQNVKMLLLPSKVVHLILACNFKLTTFRTTHFYFHFHFHFAWWKTQNFATLHSSPFSLRNNCKCWRLATKHVPLAASKNNNNNDKNNNNDCEHVGNMAKTFLQATLYMCATPFSTLTESQCYPTSISKHVHINCTSCRNPVSTTWGVLQPVFMLATWRSFVTTWQCNCLETTCDWDAFDSFFTLFLSIYVHLFFTGNFRQEKLREIRVRVEMLK